MSASGCKQLILFVTRDCPLRCAHCFVRHGRPAAAGPDITIEEARRLGSELRPIGQLSISGGEPFARPDLPELVAALAQSGRARDLDLPTAGWEPAQVAGALERILGQGGWRRVSLNLSLDGPRELHDRVRGRQGSFDRLLETYRAVLPLKQAGPLALKVVITLMPANADGLGELVRIVRSDLPGVDHAHVEPYRGPDLGQGIAPPDAATMRRCRPLVFDLYSRGHVGGPGRRGLGALGAAFKKVLWDEYTRLIEGLPPRIACRAPELGLVISEKLELALCEPGPILGSLREHSLAEILNGPAAQRERERIGRGCACTHSCFMQPAALRSAAAWLRLPAALLDRGGPC